MLIPDKDILTRLTAGFQASAEHATSIIMPFAMGLTFKLITIAIIVSAILWLLTKIGSPGCAYNNLLPEFLKYASFVYMVLQYKTIINAFISTFFKIGGVVGGIPISEQAFSSPSTVSEIGLKLMLPFWHDYIVNNIGNIIVDLTLLISGVATGGLLSTAIKMVNVAMGGIRPNSLVILLIMALITVVAIACFFMMAIHIFVIQIEFGILATLMLICVPFGIWNKTEFIFNNAKNTILNFGIKYMVLTTILSITMPLIQNIQLPAFPTYQQMLVFMLMILGLTLVTIFLPGKIAAELQG